MDRDEATTLVAKALQRVAREHGRPNTVTAAELSAYHGVPIDWAYRIGKKHMEGYNCSLLYSLLGGRAHWGRPPIYNKGRFLI